MRITSQQPLPERALTQEQRLAWTKELLSGEPDTLAYRVAGILLLLYAQPLTKIAALPTTAVVSVDGDTRILLGREPIPLSQPFAEMMPRHLATRPNLRAAGGVAQYRNRTHHVHATALIDGQNGLQTRPSNASLNHSVNHFHIAAGSGITFDTIRPGVSAARGERAPWGLPQVSPNPQINNRFRHQSKVATNRRRRRIRDSSDENGAVIHG